MKNATAKKQDIVDRVRPQLAQQARTMARQAAEAGDAGSNDVLVGDVIRTDELQVWFLSEHLPNAPLV